MLGLADGLLVGMATTTPKNSENRGVAHRDLGYCVGMWKAEPDKGSTWPTEMRIAVDLHNPELLRLLYARDSWRLDASEDLPGLGPSPAPVQITDAQRSAFAKDWSGHWSELRSWLFELEHLKSTKGIEKFTEKIAAPPIWYDVLHGDLFPEEDFEIWRAGLRSFHSDPLDEQPERKSFDALKRAWERGLTNILVLPYESPVSRVLSPHTIEIDFATYAEPELFDSALDHFSAN